MKTAQTGDKVKVHYTGSFSDGTVFDTTSNHNPLEFEIGKGNIIPGFESAVIGMVVGEKKTVEISPNEAYGEYNQELSFDVNLDEFPDNEQPELGSELEFTGPKGESLIMSVISINDTFATLDANHPLAGQTLTFEIELVEIK